MGAVRPSQSNPRRVRGEFEVSAPKTVNINNTKGGMSTARVICECVCVCGI